MPSGLYHLRIKLARCDAECKVARETGARVLEMSPSVGDVKAATDYVALFDYNVQLLVAALRQPGAR